METKNIKKAFCLALILSLVLGWLQGDICIAEETEQPIFTHGIKYEENNSPEIADNRTIKRTPIETKSEKMGSENKNLEVLKEYVLAALAIPLGVAFIPLLIAGDILCYIYYGHSCGILGSVSASGS